MKRINNLYQKIISIENLQLADENARKGKKDQYGVRLHDKNREGNILLLHEMLVNKTYKTSVYKTFKIYEPKEREIFCLPYFPDRILHHAVMNVLEDIFVSTFTADTYSCIKGKGIHAGVRSIQKALLDVEETKYCLKLDIKKFYPSVDHDILKQLLRRKFKDNDLLWLLDEIIDSADGLPIGNYLSQFFANFYLSPFDHWIKEKKRVKKYFRYADDIAIPASSKQYLHQLLADIKLYLHSELNLTVKKNYQIFLLESRGLDMLGYVFRHGYTFIRPSIKKRFAKMLVRRKNKASIASYKGWANPKYSNSRNLLKKLLHERV